MSKRKVENKRTKGLQGKHARIMSGQITYCKKRTRTRRRETKDNNRWRKDGEKRGVVGTYRRTSDLLPTPGGGAASTCLVIEQMRPRSRQLTSQCARFAAETSIVLVRTETRLDDQLAVGKERVVRTIRV